MFRHPAWAVGSYSSGPPAAETARTKSTGGFHQQDGSPCKLVFESSNEHKIFSFSHHSLSSFSSCPRWSGSWRARTRPRSGGGCGRRRASTRPQQGCNSIEIMFSLPESVSEPVPSLIFKSGMVPSITDLAFKQISSKLKQVSSKFQAGSPHNLPY